MNRALLKAWSWLKRTVAETVQFFREHKLRAVVASLFAAMFADSLVRGIVQRGPDTFFSVLGEWWEAFKWIVDHPLGEISGLIIAGWIVASSFSKSKKRETDRFVELNKAIEVERNKARQKWSVSNELHQEEIAKLLAINEGFVNASVDLFFVTQQLAQIEVGSRWISDEFRFVEDTVRSLSGKHLESTLQKNKRWMIRETQKLLSLAEKYGPSSVPSLDLTSNDLEKVAVPDNGWEAAEQRFYREWVATRTKCLSALRVSRDRLSHAKEEAHAKALSQSERARGKRR